MVVCQCAFCALVTRARSQNTAQLTNLRTNDQKLKASLIGPAHCYFILTGPCGLWPVLLATLQPQGMPPWKYDFEKQDGLKRFKYVLRTEEEKVLKELKKKCPEKKTASAVRSMTAIRKRCLLTERFNEQPKKGNISQNYCCSGAVLENYIGYYFNSQ